MSSRGALRRARPRTPRTIAGVLVTLLLGAVVAATGAPVAAAPAAAAPAATSATTLTLKDPNSAVTLEVTPGDPTAYRQGDVVHLRFAGIPAGGYVNALGTCPASGLPGVSVKELDRKGKTLLNPGRLFNLCNKHLPTNLPGSTDPTGGESPGLSTALANVYPRTDGTLDVDFRVGSGDQVEADAPIGYLNNYLQVEPALPKLVCDATHGCVIGFSVNVSGATTHWSDLTSLTIAPGKPAGTDTGACTGLDPKRTLSASGPERLQDPLAALDRGYCAAGASPIPVSYVASAVGEGPTGPVGNGADLAFAGSPALSATPLKAGQVAVPIALNGVSVAQVGGISTPSTTPGKFAYNPQVVGSLALTPADVAGIVLHAQPTSAPDWQSGDLSGYNPLGRAIASRPGNAAQLGEFDASFYGLPFVIAPTPVYGVGTSSLATALSDYVGGAAKDAWVYPTNAINTALGRSGKPVGPLTSFDPLVDHGADGTFLTYELSSINGIFSVLLSKDNPSYRVPDGQLTVCPPTSVDVTPEIRALTKGCQRFAVLDTASTVAQKLTSASLGSGSSAADYVAPSTVTLQKAAAGVLNAKGYFPAAAGAYPLTYVEYAVVPTAPLLDDACHPRTAQQAMLKDFLTWATGEGQTSLPAGLAPLTPALAAQAKAALARIGSTAPTGACAPKTPTTPTPTPTAPAPTADPGVTGGGSTTGGSSVGVGTTGGTISGGTSGGGVPSGTGAAAAGSSPPGAVAEAKERQAAGVTPVAYEPPTFSGALRTSPVSSVVGLLLLLLLVGVGAAWGAGALALPGLGRRGAGGRAA